MNCTSSCAPRCMPAAVSPTYTLRLPGPVEESDDASALPMLVKPENLRSQRQIIIDTEQLLADLKATPGMNPASTRARSEAIAEQRGPVAAPLWPVPGRGIDVFRRDDSNKQLRPHA